MASHTYDSKNRAITVQAKVKTTKDDKKPKDVSWTFDLSNVGDDEIAKLAARQLTVMAQAKYRAAKPAEREALLDYTWSVRGMLDAARIAKPKSAESLAKDVQKLTAEERQKLLEMLQGSNG